jgi:hypothetical protein
MRVNNMRMLWEHHMRVNNMRMLWEHHRTSLITMISITKSETHTHTHGPPLSWKVYLNVCQSSFQLDLIGISLLSESKNLVL